MPGEPQGIDRAVTTSQVVVALREVTRFGLMIVVTAALGRGLDAGDFGFVNYVGALYALAQVALDVGMGGLIAREIGRSPAREPALLEGALAFRGLVGLALGALVLAIELPSVVAPAQRLWLCVAAASFPLLAPAVLGVAFQVRQRQRGPAVIGVFTQALMLVGALWGLKHGWDGATFAALYVGREVLGPALLFVWTRLRLGLVLIPGLRGRGIGGLVSPMLRVAPMTLLQFASFQFGMFAVRAALPDEDLGSYSAAARVVNPLSMLAGAIAAPLLPVFARLARDRDAMPRLVSAACALGLSVGLVSLAVAGVLGRDLLELVYDSRGRGHFASGPLDATPCVHVLAVSFMAICLGSLSTTALLGAGGERALLRIFGVAFALNVLVFAILLPHVGRVAAAWGSAAAECWTAAASFVVLRRRANATLSWRAVSGALWPAGAVLLVALALPTTAGAWARVGLAAAPIGAAFAWIFVRGPGRSLRAVLNEVPA